MKLKAILGQLINNEIEELRLGLAEDSRFAIHEDEGLQVQIVVTKNKEEFLELYKPYDIDKHEKIEDIGAEAIGWAYADCCATMDNGGDPRQADMSDVLERAGRDLSFFSAH